MKNLRRLLGVVLTLAIIALPLGVWTNRQSVLDWYSLRNYTPPTKVVSLANETTMNDATRRLFYINHPEIADQASFNEVCSQEASIVLGCYISNKGIYLYNITDQRLTGVMQVTAAHELLHAAYERLSTKERNQVDAMTTEAFANIKNERLLTTVEKYRSQDPGVVSNELHSIIATEVRDLSPALETYYKKYFTNRLAIVAFSEQYEGEFSRRQSQVATYDGQLETTKAQIEAGKQELTLQYSALTIEKNRLEALKNSGDIPAYNTAVPAFNEQVNDYNQLVKKTDTLINNYNKLVIQRNDLALEVQGLAKAIDSRPQSF